MHNRLLQEFQQKTSAKNIYDLVICPIDVTKPKKEEFDNEYKKKEDEYTSSNIQELWKQRTNQPYKNILKDENYNKQINNQQDLIVYKVSQKDRNEEMLEKEYNKLKSIIETHNNDLKILYSASEITKLKQEFEFVNKHKHKIAYDPKDFSALKEYYEKEQKKIDNETKRLDNLINMIVNDEEEDIDEIKDSIKNSGIKSIIDNDTKEKYRSKNKK